MMRLLATAAKATIGFVVIFLAKTLSKDSNGQEAAPEGNAASPSKPSVSKAEETSLPPLPADVKYENTVWIPRILWALEWSRLQSEPSATAADLARILQSECKLDVRPNNMARAFRQLKEKKTAEGLWATAGKGYKITDRGRETLARLV